MEGRPQEGEEPVEASILDDLEIDEALRRDAVAKKEADKAGPGRVDQPPVPDHIKGTRLHKGLAGRASASEVVLTPTSTPEEPAQPPIEDEEVE